MSYQYEMCKNIVDKITIKHYTSHTLTHYRNKTMNKLQTLQSVLSKLQVVLNQYNGQFLVNKTTKVLICGLISQRYDINFVTVLSYFDQLVDLSKYRCEKRSISIKQLVAIAIN